MPRRLCNHCPTPCMPIVSSRLRYVFRRLHGFLHFGAHASQTLERRRQPPSYDCLPMLSSECPGWICFAEKTYPQAIPYISTTKSPQQITGALLKHEIARRAGLQPKQVYHATVMPCFDKKLEASRKDFMSRLDSSPDVDCVISSAEVVELLDELGVSFDSLQSTCDADGDVCMDAAGSGEPGAYSGGAAGGSGAGADTAASADGGAGTGADADTGAGAGAGAGVGAGAGAGAGADESACSVAPHASLKSHIEGMLQNRASGGASVLRAVERNAGSNGYAAAGVWTDTH